MDRVHKNIAKIPLQAVPSTRQGAFFRLQAHLSRCRQHGVPVQVIGKVAKPYFYPRPHNSYASHHKKTACHLCLYPKHMLNPRPYPCPSPVPLLLLLAQLSPPKALALYLLHKPKLPKPLQRPLRQIRRISIYLRAAVVLVQKLLNHLTVMYRRISHVIAPDEFMLYITTHLVLIAIVGCAILFSPACINIFLPLLCLMPLLGV